MPNRPELQKVILREVVYCESCGEPIHGPSAFRFPDGKFTDDSLECSGNYASKLVLQTKARTKADVVIIEYDLPAGP